MIQPNELRIGNYVLFDSNIDKIISIGVKSVNAEFKSMWNYDRVHPIALTPEIVGLLACCLSAMNRLDEQRKNLKK